MSTRTYPLPDGKSYTVAVDESRWPTECYRCYAYVGEQCVTYANKPTRTHARRHDSRRDGPWPPNVGTEGSTE